MSDMKTIMENFRQFERKDMENRIDELLKENKNLKKQLNKARKLHEGVMGGLGVSPLKIGAATAVGKRAAVEKAERRRIGGQLHAIAEAIGAQVNCGGVDIGNLEGSEMIPIDIEPGDIILVPRGGSTSTERERKDAMNKAELLRKEILQYLGEGFRHVAPHNFAAAIASSMARSLSIVEDAGIGYQLSLVGSLKLQGCQLIYALGDASEQFGFGFEA
jgi:hypothetical protein